mgnify:CR=1 FL=1
MTLTRHFTATGFVVHKSCVALHWHLKVKAWLPPGGHIEPNEDPLQTVLREILEESGLIAEVVATSPPLGFTYPTSVEPPYTIMVEDIDDPVQGFHQHIDFIYFCRLKSVHLNLSDGWRWVSRNELVSGALLTMPDGEASTPADDVRTLGVTAIDLLKS